jgi:hypothetical protein
MVRLCSFSMSLPRRMWTMRKAGKIGLGLLMVAAAGLAVIPQVAGTESLLRKVNYLDRGIEAYLPPASPAVPWLNIDRKTKLPKGDYPIGREVEMTPLVLHFPHMEDTDLAEFALGGG